MLDIILFHSVLGLRPVEHRAADRLRAAGHRVTAPDLYAGEVASTLDAGFALTDRIGWPVVEQRARAAVRELPGHTVLAGFSMGASVVDALLPDRPDTAAVLLLHNTAGIPATARAGLPVHLHVADPDPFVPDPAGWLRDATNAGAAAEVFTYPGAGHFYVDADLPDHDEQAAALTWERVLEFLRTVRRTPHR